MPNSKTIKYDQLIDDMRAEYRPQREWAERRGLFLVGGHFLVGVAAGAWLFGLLFGMPDTLVASYCLAILGGLSHLAFLGRPSRVLNMVMRARTSWISRGFFGLSLFLGGGLLYLLPILLPNPPWDAASPIAEFGSALAFAGMLVLICYMGFVYTASKAIPFWNSPLHPLLYVGYACRGGVALALLTMAVRGQEIQPGAGLIQFWLAITAAVIVLWLLEVRSAATGGESAARRSVHDLLAGRVAIYFYAGTLGVGLLVPALMIGGFGAALSVPALAVIGIASVTGDFFMKFTTIKAGVYRPLRLHQPYQRA
ncbi:MAG: NrfD/PsrC family molybdoenzyme membrane anchor subunit [Alphaproteobacteria bacterium]